MLNLRTALALLLPSLLCFGCSWLMESLIVGPDGYYLPMRLLSNYALYISTLLAVALIAWKWQDKLPPLIIGLLASPLAGLLFELVRSSFIGIVRVLALAFIYAMPFATLAFTADVLRNGWGSLSNWLRGKRN